MPTLWELRENQCSYSILRFCKGEVNFGIWMGVSKFSVSNIGMLHVFVNRKMAIGPLPNIMNCNIIYYICNTINSL